MSKCQAMCGAIRPRGEGLFHFFHYCSLEKGHKGKHRCGAPDNCGVEW